jgi:hypothetical protein
MYGIHILDHVLVETSSRCPVVALLQTPEVLLQGNGLLCSPVGVLDHPKEKRFEVRRVTVSQELTWVTEASVVAEPVFRLEVNSEKRSIDEAE